LALALISTLRGQVFDYLLTLSRERHLIWNQPFSIVTFIFLVTRYLPFIDTAAATFREYGSSFKEIVQHPLIISRVVSLDPSPSKYSCTILYRVQASMSSQHSSWHAQSDRDGLATVGYFVGLFGSESILLARTAAVWDNKKRVFWPLVILLVVIEGGSVFLVERYMALSTAGCVVWLLRFE
jgi:hypothetical protein